MIATVLHAAWLAVRVLIFDGVAMVSLAALLTTDIR